MDLIKLSQEDLGLEEYKELLARGVTSKDDLLIVINNLAHSLYFDDTDERIQLLAPYFEKYKMRKSTILRKSHVFCKTCQLYTPSDLSTWAENNKELFETEVAFYYKLFTKFPGIIKDVSTYPFEDLYQSHTPIVFVQTNKEKLKMLNSVVTFYYYYTK